DGMEAVIQPLNDNWMIGSWQYGTRNRTKDGGQTRQGVGNPENGAGEADWIAPLLLDPNQQMRVYHFSDNIFRSEEFGDGWEMVSSPNIDIIQGAAIAYNNSNILAISRGSTLLLSQDAGQNWNMISFGLPGFFITDITFAPNDDSTLAVTFDRYQNDNQKIFISHDLGNTWENITYNLGNMPLRTVAIDHTPDANIYVGGEIGVYYKSMNDTAWTAYSPGLPNVAVRDLEIQFGANAIKAATWGRGLWDFHLAGRKDFPAILKTNLADNPTEIAPRQDIDQFVTSVISYDGNLTSVYIQWSVNNHDLDHTILMTNTSDSTWVSQTPIPGDQPNNSDVFFKVFAVGDNNDTTETYRYMYKVRSYCPSYGNQDFFTAITQVSFGDIQKFSAKDEGYNDYTLTDSAILEKGGGKTYSLNVMVNTNNEPLLLARAWIDWNHNKTFDLPAEEYNLGFVANAPPGQLTSNSPLSITVPSGALLGKTTMRVSVKGNSVPTACETDFDGEVEDYTIIVEECKPNTEVTATT
ncbi:MAG: hypothetical protein KDD63_10355, partial [Bacteroidetes bacterium]|nr:hypothetical protein [Bacteroidota bacterium]